MGIVQNTVESHAEINALHPHSPHVRDALEGMLGKNSLLKAFEAEDYDLFKSLCPSDELPSILWDEAQRLVRNVGAYLASKNYPDYTKSNNLNDALDRSSFEYNQRWGTPYIFGSRLYSHDLPRTGDKYEHCGTHWIKEGKACLEVGKHLLQGQYGIVVKRQNSSCNRLSCPICGVKAMHSRAGKIANKFMRMPAYHHSVKLDDRKKPQKLNKYTLKRVKTPESKSLFGKPVHATVSMPPELEHLLTTNEGLKELEKQADDIAKRVGMHGYVSIYHHIRLDEEENEPKPLVYSDEINNDFGKLEEIIERQNAMFGAVKPHWHLIGYCHDENGQTGRVNGKEVAKMNEETGWVFVIMHPADEVQSVFSTAFYALTHCGVAPNSHSIRWVGTMSNGKGWFSKYARPAIPPQPSKCPICESNMKKYQFTGENSPFDLPDEKWQLVPAVDLDKFIEVHYLHADTVITSDTSRERIEALGYDKPPDGGD